MMPGTAPNYNVLTIQSDLIETVGHADAISARALGDYNRVRRSLEVTIPFDPTLTVDDGVTIVAPSIGVSCTCAIWDIQHDVTGGGTTTITTNQGTYDRRQRAREPARRRPTSPIRRQSARASNG